MRLQQTNGMIDIGHKKPTKRIAKATATIYINTDTSKKIANGTMPKGNVLEYARIAGIMAGKKTCNLIPLCHPIPIDSITITFNLKPDALIVEATVQSMGKTGVEMEALVAVSTATLTIYDMCKIYDKTMTITDIMLLEKKGGKSGYYIHKS